MNYNFENFIRNILLILIKPNIISMNISYNNLKI